MKRKTITLRRVVLVLPAIVSSLLFITSCSNESNHVPVDPVPDVPGARITDSLHYDKEKATVFNIEYPSLDPYGNPATLSGSIVLGDEIREDNHIKGTVLYNHFTVYQKDQCPSRGDVVIPLKVVGTRMITVAPDYYGFGATGDKNQAYCIPSANGQASVDCLIAARNLLQEKGYVIDDLLLNLGYSEGAQTSIAVLRLCAQQHPEIKITHTLAGGGPYDICETYRQMIVSKKTAMPSTVISSLLAYNEYFKLGYQYSDMFLEPTRSNIDKYLLSKDYKQKDIETNLATENIADWVVPELLDFNSPISLNFMSAFSRDILTQGWNPNTQWRITLVHNNLDSAVPVANCQQLEKFFESKGFTMAKKREEGFNDGSVYVQYFDYPEIQLGADKIGAHELGALNFLAEINAVFTHYLGQPFFMKLTMDDLKNF